MNADGTGQKNLTNNPGGEDMSLVHKGLREFAPLVDRQLRHSLRGFEDVTAVSPGLHMMPPL